MTANTIFKSNLGRKRKKRNWLLVDIYEIAVGAQHERMLEVTYIIISPRKKASFRKHGNIGFSSEVVESSHNSCCDCCGTIG